MTLSNLARMIKDMNKVSERITHIEEIYGADSAGLFTEEVEELELLKAKLENEFTQFLVVNRLH